MSNPNKTVAAARRRMGGFPSRAPRPVDPFVEWLVAQARAGRTFTDADTAREVFEHEEANPTSKPGALAARAAEILAGKFSDRENLAIRIARLEQSEARDAVERLVKAAEAAARHFKTRAKSADDAMVCVMLADAAAAARGDS